MRDNISLMNIISEIALVIQVHRPKIKVNVELLSNIQVVLPRTKHITLKQINTTVVRSDLVLDVLTE